MRNIVMKLHHLLYICSLVLNPLIYGSDTLRDSAVPHIPATGSSGKFFVEEGFPLLGVDFASDPVSVAGGSDKIAGVKSLIEVPATSVPTALIVGTPATVVPHKKGLTVIPFPRPHTGFGIGGSGLSPSTLAWLFSPSTPYASSVPTPYSWHSPSHGSLNNPLKINDFVQRQTVKSIESIGANVKAAGKAIVCIDADEVLFTTEYVESSGVEQAIRLHKNLEGLLTAIRAAGHKIYILTYNRAETIKSKLASEGINLALDLFDGIVSAEMTGDVMTTKGRLFKRIINEATPRPAYAIFIDNFPVFVEDVERVAEELSMPLYSYVSVGYKGHYKHLVFHRLRRLAERLKAGEDISIDRKKIEVGLEKYGINLETFLETYPEFGDFKAAISGKDLIWPYCTYM